MIAYVPIDTVAVSFGLLELNTYFIILAVKQVVRHTVVSVIVPKEVWPSLPTELVSLF